MGTIIIHGTLARDSPWWRVPKPGGFLEALSKGMRQGGREPDVWTIGGRPVSSVPQLRPRGGFDVLRGRIAPPFEQIEGHFRWPGNNLHKERQWTGEELARYLEALARLSPRETIDIVAHSHGGNLVKVASNHLSANVRLGRIVLLAVPHCVNVAGAGESDIYRMNPASLPREAGGARPVLNLYSEEDTVQTDLAGGFPDFIPAPGTRTSPVFEAHRTDQDRKARAVYDDFQLPTRLGRGTHVHGAMHGPKVGLLIGYWLARWPELRGAECLYQLGMGPLIERDAG